MPRPLLILSALAFAAVAFYASRVLATFASRRGLRRPHAALVTVFRLWFALLSLATLWILLHRPGR